MMLIFRKYLFPGSICIDVKRDAIIIKNRMLQQNKHVFDSDWNCEKKLRNHLVQSVCAIYPNSYVP